MTEFLEYAASDGEEKLPCSANFYFVFSFSAKVKAAETIEFGVWAQKSYITIFLYHPNEIVESLNVQGVIRVTNKSLRPREPPGVFEEHCSMFHTLGLGRINEAKNHD